MMVKIYVKKITSNVTPCNTVVLPILRDSIIISRDKKKSILGTASIPSVIWLPVANATIDTMGMVSPILAKADPRERFRLFCSSLFFAALYAVRPSGSSTIHAMTTPANVWGA